jgi:hypothetical protein
MQPTTGGFRATSLPVPMTAEGRKWVFDPYLGTTASMHSADNQQLGGGNESESMVCLDKP